VIVVASLSLNLHVLQLVDNLVFALDDLLDLSIFCLRDCFNKLAFKFVNALLQLVEVAVDSFEVPSKLVDNLLCVLRDDWSHRILDVFSHF
jgi:hypothetical protein